MHSSRLPNYRLSEVSMRCFQESVYKEYAARHKEGLLDVTDMVRSCMWRETKKRVNDEVSLPSISNSRVELCLTPEEQRWYDACFLWSQTTIFSPLFLIMKFGRYRQAERLCVQSLRGMLRDNCEQRRHAAEEGLPNPPLVLPSQFPALFSTIRLRCCHSQVYPIGANARPKVASTYSYIILRITICSSSSTRSSRLHRICESMRGTPAPTMQRVCAVVAASSMRSKRLF